MDAPVMVRQPSYDYESLDLTSKISSLLNERLIICI